MPFFLPLVFGLAATALLGACGRSGVARLVAAPEDQPHRVCRRNDEGYIEEVTLASEEDFQFEDVYLGEEERCLVPSCEMSIPTRVHIGELVDLEWSTENATRVTIQQEDDYLSLDSSGQVEVAVGKSTHFRIVASNSLGHAVCTADVEVIPDPWKLMAFSGSQACVLPLSGNPDFCEPLPFHENVDENWIGFAVSANQSNMIGIGNPEDFRTPRPAYQLSSFSEAVRQLGEESLGTPEQQLRLGEWRFAWAGENYLYNAVPVYCEEEYPNRSTCDDREASLQIIDPGNLNPASTDSGRTLNSIPQSIAVREPFTGQALVQPRTDEAYYWTVEDPELMSINGINSLLHMGRVSISTGQVLGAAMATGMSTYCPFNSPDGIQHGPDDWGASFTPTGDILAYTACDAEGSDIIRPMIFVDQINLDRPVERVNLNDYFRSFLPELTPEELQQFIHDGRWQFLDEETILWASRQEHDGMGVITLWRLPFDGERLTLGENPQSVDVMDYDPDLAEAWDFLNYDVLLSPDHEEIFVRTRPPVPRTELRRSFRFSSADLLPLPFDDQQPYRLAGFIQTD
jgi:hypothetical protein